MDGLNELRKRVYRFTGMLSDEAFAEREKCHDWRNHVPEEIVAAWRGLDETQRLLVIATAEMAAAAEEWD